MSGFIQTVIKLPYSTFSDVLVEAALPTSIFSDIIDDSGRVDFNILVPEPDAVSRAHNKYVAVYNACENFISSAFGDVHPYPPSTYEPAYYNGVLVNNAGSMSEAQFMAFSEWVRDHYQEALGTKAERTPMQPQLFDFLMMRRELGVVSPIKWNIKHWGCRDNAETISVKDGQVIICTVNSPPRAWLNALCDKHKGKKITFTCVES